MQIKCFYVELAEYDERGKKLTKKGRYLQFLRKIGRGVCFELASYHDVWAVYKACRLSGELGEPMKVSVRKTNRGMFRVWRIV